jgi:hypothetical protein
LVVLNDELLLTCTRYSAVPPPGTVEGFHCRVIEQDEEQVASGSFTRTGVEGGTTIHGVFTFHC